MTKIIVFITFLAILISLGNALFHLVKNEGPSKKTVNALTIRISISILLLIFVFIAIATGLITPHGIGANLHRQSNLNQTVLPSEK